MHKSKCRGASGAPDSLIDFHTGYNWYEPGASLRRHGDEFHEETKGPKGWLLPTRRSLTWLLYLNKEWRADEGGALRAYERARPCDHAVGATDDGGVLCGISSGGHNLTYWLISHRRRAGGMGRRGPRGARVFWGRRARRARSL